ncbi:MAG TPA: glycosyltransferase family 4 protein, partial [Clostridia bacterium]|nr:glycosyltransferase family 4 protein [Clostridia bacterium]
MHYLLLNQTFYPDVMATGQYLAEVAQGLVEQGHEVTVITSRRAYDEPGKTFAPYERWKGVRIYRVACTGFGKGAKWRRAMDFASFTLSCCVRLLRLRRVDRVLALTTPPLISFIGAVYARMRGSRFYYWVMDFNPDEAIAAGWLRAGSLPARALEWMSRYSLRQATKVIALDRFMRERILAKGIGPRQVEVIPPWSHDGEVRFDAIGRERFRKAHGLESKCVVMYSGNHSPVHPLKTLLEAAEQLAGNQDLLFCFVGGGSEWRRIRDRKRVASQPAPAMMCLPYQPLDELAGSLSAADIHVVVMGDAMLGLVHPCKIYNILSVGAPILYIGPKPSHVTEVLGVAGDGEGGRRPLWAWA